MRARVVLLPQNAEIAKVIGFPSCARAWCYRICNLAKMAKLPFVRARGVSQKHFQIRNLRNWFPFVRVCVVLHLPIQGVILTPMEFPFVRVAFLFMMRFYKSASNASWAHDALVFPNPLKRLRRAALRLKRNTSTPAMCSRCVPEPEKRLVFIRRSKNIKQCVPCVPDVFHVFRP